MTVEPWAVWTVIAAAGAGTFMLRFSFLGVLRRGVDEIPELVRRALRLIPAAVLAAFAAPALTHPEGSFDLWNDRLLAGLIAAVVAWRNKSVLATIAVGMGVLWLLQALG